MHPRLIALTLLLFLAPPTFILYPAEQVFAQAPKQTPEEAVTEGVYINADCQNVIYSNSVTLEDLQSALAKCQKALAIFKKYGAKAGEANSLTHIGYFHFRQGEYSQALQLFQSALAIHKSNRDQESEWIPLSYIAEVYVNQVNYPQALETYQSTLNILRKIKAANPKSYSYATSEVEILTSISSLYFRMGQYQKALDSYQQTLAVQQAEGDKFGGVQTLNNIGVTYVNLGNYPQAISAYEQALKPIQEFCYPKTGAKLCYYGLEAAILNNLSGVYFSLGQPQKALEFADKSATIYKKIRSGEYQGTSKKDIQLLYNALGENAHALQQATNRANVGDAFGKDAFQFQGEALNLNNIGQIYLGLGKYDQALTLYQQALNIYKENKYPLGIAVALNNIAQVYKNQGKYAQAIDLNQQALVNYREVGDRTGEGVTISNLGQIYQKQTQYPQAFDFYQRALAMHREVSDKVSEASTLKYTGDVLSLQNQPQLAIAFYKQSVNLTETIRQSLQAVPTDLQQSYTEIVADRYRRLADLLLQQNRPSEAQQVLDLLKIQEVHDFIGNRRGKPEKVASTSIVNAVRSGNLQTSSSLPLQPQEQQISQKYSVIQDQAIALGKELTTLRKISPTSRTTVQQKRIKELVKLEEETAAEFNKFTKNPAVVTLVQQLSVTSGQENVSLRQLNSLRTNLRELNSKAVLLYPLVLEDRLEVVLVSADAPPIHRSVLVKQEELTNTITEYRQAIASPWKDIKTPANKLYTWLIKPIENDLKQADAKTIIYAPDGKLRYLPLAALYDGKNWLVERFVINNITAASLTKLNNQPQKSLQTLAAAFTTGDFKVAVGQRQAEFSGLKFAKTEVENLALTIPGTKILLDKEFSPQITIPQMNDFKIVHLATHGMLISGDPEDSFILFGNGQRVTLRDIENWSLPNVDLVVLSACQTALGNKLGNGQEILGLGYQMQLTGAKASIASLWTVSDGGTQSLMNNFYKILKAGNVTKSEALQKSQISLLTGNNTQYQHPYYWAAFILIGNGL